MKLYTMQQLIKKYSNKYVDIYPHHHTKWCDKTHKYITVFEVRGVKQQIHEGFNTPQEWQADFANHNYTLEQLAKYSEYFTKIAIKFDLVEEFTENGII